MAKFERCFPSELQEALKKPPLYTECLLRDICSGEVFPAFRNNKIDFYHKGGRLFEFDGNEFTTHVKYASVLHGYGKPYIKENLLDYGNVRLIRDFKEGYTRIKENCSLHSGLEASEVARIYTESSFSKKPLEKDEKSDAIELKEEEKPHNQSFPKFDQNVVVLDIEVSLKSLDRDWKDEIPDEGKKGKKRTQLDILDLLLFNKSERCLQFFEAKHFGNKELWSKPGKPPKVVSQIQRYNKQLKARNEEILQAYKNYARTVRELFGLSEESMPNPVSLEKDVVLLVFGFDSRQREKLKKLLIEDGSLNGIRYRFIGKPKDAGQMWNNNKFGK